MARNCKNSQNNCSGRTIPGAAFFVSVSHAALDFLPCRGGDSPFCHSGTVGLFPGSAFSVDQGKNRGRIPPGNQSFALETKMQNVSRLLIYFAICMLFVLGVASTASGFIDRVERYYRDKNTACKQEFDHSEVHMLPMGIGKFDIEKCFSKGFTTITPDTEKIGECRIKVKTPSCPERDCRISCPPRKFFCNKCTRIITVVRRKYHCRFKGAGAILGETKEARETGSEVFFRGEEPQNFIAKDPGCEEIFEELSSRDDKYCTLTD